MALYRHAIKEGTASEAKLFLQVIEDWAERSRHEVAADLSEDDVKKADAIMGIVRDKKEAKTEPQVAPKPNAPAT